VNLNLNPFKGIWKYGFRMVLVLYGMASETDWGGFYLFK
jgi:hypothetical protein